MALRQSPSIVVHCLNGEARRERRGKVEKICIGYCYAGSGPVYDGVPFFAANVA